MNVYRLLVRAPVLLSVSSHALRHNKVSAKPSLVTFSLTKSGRSVKLTTDGHLSLTLRMHGAFSLQFIMACCVNARKVAPVLRIIFYIWGCASKTNIAIIQRAQSKILRSITNAPWYVSNLTLHKDLETPYVTETIRENSTKHYNKLENHSNPLLQPLLQPHENRGLQRNWPADLR
jgi:hypothetical protein